MSIALSAKVKELDARLGVVERGVCPRCGVVHTCQPFDFDKALAASVSALKDQIEADLLAALKRKPGRPPKNG